MSTYTANQPLLFPSIYMMNRYWNSNVLVIMEEAQFTKFGHQSRVEIMTPQGKHYLTVPLHNRNFRPINEVEVDNPQRVVETFKRTLQTVYGPYPGFKSNKTSLWSALDRAGKTTNLAEFNAELLGWLFTTLTMPPLVVRSVDVLPIRPEHPSEWVAALGSAVNCTTYLGGETAQTAYIRELDFNLRGISLQSQRYILPRYTSVKKQIVGKSPKDGWVSILDPLLIGGVNLALSLIDRPAY